MKTSIAQGISKVCENYQGASDRAIQYHYDTGNEFYKLWLDPSLTYSCAMWNDSEGTEALQAAQERKIDYFISEAEASNQEQVLEIGCGWGALANRLTQLFGVSKVTALTLSRAQAEWILSSGNRKIDVRIENWFDHKPEAEYDAIISVAAFEAFAKPGLSDGERNAAYRQFFLLCHKWMKPGRRLVVQTIACGNMHREDFNKFIASEVFPESDLPTLADIAIASDRLFEIVTIRNDRNDYVKTLKAWRNNLKKNRAAAVALVSEDVVQKYERYLDLSTLGFHTGSAHLLRFTFRRIDKPVIFEKQ